MEVILEERSSVFFTWMCSSSSSVLQNMGTTAEFCGYKLEQQLLQRVLVNACFAVERALKSKQLEKPTMQPWFLSLRPRKVQKWTCTRLWLPTYLLSAKFLYEQDFWNTLFRCLSWFKVTYWGEQPPKYAHFILKVFIVL